MVGRLQRTPTVGVGAGGVFGVFNLLVDRGLHDVAIVTIVIPFAPAAAAFTKVAGGARVEVIGRPEPTGRCAGLDVDVVVAERITVLFAAS